MDRQNNTKTLELDNNQSSLDDVARMKLALIYTAAI